MCIVCVTCVLHVCVLCVLHERVCALFVSHESVCIVCVTCEKERACVFLCVLHDMHMRSEVVCSKLN